MQGSNQLTSTCMSPSETRQMVLDIERTGIDTSRISVETNTAVSDDEMDKVDHSNLTRPVHRAGGAAAGGALVGAIVGAIVASLGGFMLVVGILLGALAGAVLGGLVGLYSKLPMNTEVSDVDTGDPSLITVDVNGLSEEETAKVADAMNQEARH